MASDNQPPREWNVRVHRKGSSFSQFLGTVMERTEELARCAALNKYSVDENDSTNGIGPDEEFDVSPRN